MGRRRAGSAMQAPIVMQSFRSPRPTTNPYIVQLDRSLAGDPDIDHRRFDWRRSLVGRVDVLHLHWPEVLLGADTPLKRLGKRILMRMLLIRLARGRLRLVRTVHNVELPDVEEPTRRLLVALDARTAHRILLNPVTEADPERSTLIPHGHYREWFASYPRQPMVPDRLGYFGLIRRYKGVESLLDAFADARAADPSLTLRVGGRPSTPDLEQSISARVAATPGVTSILRFLDDAEIVEIASSSQLLVFPYRFMHNSGGALAALSLDRPVLLPSNEVNRRLADEAGEGWVQLYDGELTADTLRAALGAVAGLSGTPHLEDRDWATVGRRHAAVYDRVLRDAR